LLKQTQFEENLRKDLTFQASGFKLHSNPLSLINKDKIQ